MEAIRVSRGVETTPVVSTIQRISIEPFSPGVRGEGCGSLGWCGKVGVS